MYCKNCGAQLGDGAKFCNLCGVLSGNGDAFCAYCGKEVPIGSAYCQNCGESLNGNEEVILKKFDGENVTPTQARENFDKSKATQTKAVETKDFFADVEVPNPQPERPVNAQSTYSMKWYKFLLVIIFISAIANFIGGIGYLTGLQYDVGVAEFIYDYYPGMKTLDVLYGIYVLAMGVYCFMLRSALKGFKAKAPKMLILLYVLNAVAYLIYAIITTAIIGVETAVLMTDIVSQVAVSAIMIAVNKKYFKTREELFIN